MSFGYSRPHSTDSWRSRRPSFELSSRMHSVPRNVKSTSRPTTGNFSSDFNFVESPLYYMHRNDASIGRESISPRNSARAFDREDNFSSKYQHKHYDKELQRKMTFNLHEEIEKPYLTIVLEEISDPDRINDICLNTLTSMMRSKTYRKFLHHMNNSALTNSHRYDTTHSNSIPGKAQKGNKEERDAAGGMATTSWTSGDKPARMSTVAKEKVPEFEEYRKNALLNRKRRQDEINALEKLKGRLPPIKKTTKRLSKTLKLKDEVDDDASAGMETPTTKVPKFSMIINSIAASKTPSYKNSEDVVSSTPQAKQKNRPKGTAEEILRTRYLRLTDSQVEDLEAEMKASGNDPGIHHFSKKETVDAFAATLVTKPAKFKEPSDKSKRIEKD